ncbi:MAG: major facilitator superfamily domain-containing protein [Monoraphidium minutum]|nr:MAG: major facilitator superfamily domain-containing protein [Monoraphidium minutum]
MSLSARRDPEPRTAVVVGAGRRWPVRRDLLQLRVTGVDGLIQFGPSVVRRKGASSAFGSGGELKGPGSFAEGGAGAAGVAAVPGGGGEADLNHIYRKVTWSIAPLFMATTMMSTIDRGNLSYASISFIPTLKLTPTAYGVGSSLFFATYILGLVPFGLLAPHVGARRLLAGLLVAWGAVATCMAAVRNEAGFFALRLLLGACESGAMPCMWAHLMQFYPKHRLPRPFAYLYMGIALAGIVGAPLAAGLLALDGRGGLHGYQWLFILEGAPAVLLGALVFLTLPDRPAAVRGLAPPEVAALEADLASEAADQAARKKTPARALMGAVLRGRYFPLLAAAFFIAGVIATTYVYWTPLIINSLLKGSTLSRSAAAGGSARSSLPAVGLSTLPMAVAAVTCFLNAAHAQRRREVFLHAALPLAAAGVITVCFPFMAEASPVLGFISLVLTLACALAANPAITSINALIHKGPEETIALPMLDTFLNLGAVVGAPITGAIIQKTSRGFFWVTIVMGILILILVMGILILVAASLLLILRAWVARGPLAQQLYLTPKGRAARAAAAGAAAAAGGEAANGAAAPPGGAAAAGGGAAAVGGGQVVIEVAGGGGGAKA